MYLGTYPWAPETIPISSKLLDDPCYAYRMPRVITKIEIQDKGFVTVVTNLDELCN